MNFKNPIFLTKPILKNILENWAVVSKVLLSYLCFSAVIFWLPSDLTGQVFPVIVHFPYLWRRSVSLLFLPRTMLHHRVECGRLLMVVDYSLLIIMISRLLSIKNCMKQSTSLAAMLPWDVNVSNQRFSYFPLIFFASILFSEPDKRTMVISIEWFIWLYVRSFWIVALW